MKPQQFDIIIAEADLTAALSSYQGYLENLEREEPTLTIHKIMALGEFHLFRIETDQPAASQLAEYLANWLTDTNRQYVLYIYRQVVLNRVVPDPVKR